MKYLKFSFIMIFAIIFMAAFVPHLSAKHKRHSFFGFSLNFDTRPKVVTYVAPAPVVPVPVVAPVAVCPVPMETVQPAPVAAMQATPIPVQPAPIPVVHTYYPSRAYVQPAYYTSPAKVYVRPQFSYWTYR